MKDFKQTTEPFCESCGDLEPYALTKEKGGTTWCICCSSAEGDITQSEYMSLYEQEKTLAVEYFKSELAKLENK